MKGTRPLDNDEIRPRVFGTVHSKSKTRRRLKEKSVNNKTTAVLLTIALLFIGGCGDGLSDYQSEIIEKAESIIASDNVSELSPREVYVLLGLLYTECVKLKEHKNVGQSHDKLFAAFSNLIPTYRNLLAEEKEKQDSLRVDNLIKTSKAIIDGSDEALAERRNELETQVQKLERHMSEMVADEQELFNSLLRITNEKQEEPIWAKAKARDYLREFHDLIGVLEKVDE